MKESIEEFGATLIVCVIGSIALVGLGVLLKESGIFAELAQKYAEFFH